MTCLIGERSTDMTQGGVRCALVRVSVHFFLTVLPSQGEHATLTYRSKGYMEQSQPSHSEDNHLKQTQMHKFISKRKAHFGIPLRFSDCYVPLLWKWFTNENVQMGYL